MRILHALLVVLMGLLAMGLAPEPDPIPRRWQLDFTPGPLRVVTVDVDGVGPRQYFYLTYKVVNGTGQDQLFAPAMDLSTSHSLAQRSGRNVPAQVTKHILEMLENPFLVDQISIVGPLLQGEANTKEGLAVWPVPTERSGELSVYIAGLSGETRPIEVKDPKSGEISRVLLRKTLTLKYDMPGEIIDRGSVPFSLAEKRWIMR